jgi:hypothetical protein
MHDFGWLGRKSTGSMSCSRLVWAVQDDENLACPIVFISIDLFVENLHVVECLQMTLPSPLTISSRPYQ